jgi:DNA-binding transcriptional LysR family regulator
MEAFRAIMSHGSATQAAAAMHISQPAVSRLIADFEAALGVLLFEREHGRLKPTAEAHLLFQESSMAFSGLARLREAATSLRELQRGRIRIVSETVYAEGFIPRLAAAYHVERPDVHMELDTGPSARIADWIAETWYDLGLVVLPVSQSDVSVRFLRRQFALCAVPPGHRLAGQSVVRLEELAGERFVAPVANTPYRILFDRALKSAGVEPDIRFEARTQHGICAFVAAGAGIALVEPCVAEDMGVRSAVFLPCEPSIYWDIALIVPKARSPSLVCKNFIDYLTEHADGYFSFNKPQIPNLQQS